MSSVRNLCIRTGGSCCSGLEAFLDKKGFLERPSAEAGVEWKCGLIYAVSGTCLLHQAVSPEWVYNVCVLLPQSREEQLHSVMPGP